MSEARQDLRVLVVAEHASLKIGGEASLPYYYFKLLRHRNIQAWMIVHARFRNELKELLAPTDFARVHFIEDTTYHRALWRIGQWLPQKVDEQTLETLRHIRTQLGERKIAKQLIRQHAIDVVHEVEPISPKQVSAMMGLGAPVVMGPMCGGMTYPPAFEYLQGRASRWVEKGARAVSELVNWVVPGKRQAAALVVANEHTRRALPKGARGMIYELPESGVDLALWRETTEGERPTDGKVRFVFSGRLIPLKGVDLLVEAFRLVVAKSGNAVLEIIGDGPMRPGLEQRVRDLGIKDWVNFSGWLSRAEGAARVRVADVMVMPSLRECGGTVILEAMAMGVPVIATNWGGPGNYVNDETGIRVKPDSRQGFIDGLAEAMVRLAGQPDERKRMGEAGKRRIRAGYFDWDSKVDRMIEIYRETVVRARAMEEIAAGEPCGCC